jgi:hypothetical protein
MEEPIRRPPSRVVVVVVDKSVVAGIADSGNVRGEHKSLYTDDGVGDEDDDDDGGGVDDGSGCTRPAIADSQLTDAIPKL